ncbi:hypothetical protein B4U79_11290 [Dinothrombium tinctorium]|uniref:Uncharacterized protein n=1 Tax=Dinothrombium tinctorium TaxID=1965070 RepID=A0A3S3P0I0_9ACAR|nr:hypothetical protein B4U79_11290 [Dinothrombium tinctorium]
MRLTRVLCKYRPEFHGFIPKFRGKVEIGRHRYVPAITKGMKYTFFREASYEFEVMKYLQKPFITEEQERAYLQSIGRTQPVYADDHLNKNLVFPLKQRYAADLLARLDVSRKFEEED